MSSAVRFVSSLFLASCSAALVAAEDAAKFEFETKDDRIEITVAGEALASYVFRDNKISRPYFAHVKVASEQLTRDCGFTAANPCGKKAFRAGPVSTICVPAGESFRLRYGIFLYNTATAFDCDDVYAEFLKMSW